MKKKMGNWLRRLLAATLCLLLCCIPVAAVQEYLIPGGFTVGIELATEGILIVEVESGTGAARAGLQKGDTIIKINGAELLDVEALRAAACVGSVLLQVRRNGTEAEFLVEPDRDGRLGLLVRDHIAGIGTVSFIDPETGAYGALGHGVNDLVTTRLLPVEDGKLVAASICSVRKGTRGAPGELCGEFDVMRHLGTVEKNTDSGVFGKMDVIPGISPLPVCTAADIKEGEASILTNVSGTEVCEYAIQIVRLIPEAKNGRNLLLKVTDPSLLAITGGIVQGMSGSPIIQDGKLIGAVTHVLVNQPDTGYGIFIENMLDAAD